MQKLFFVFRSGIESEIFNIQNKEQFEKNITELRLDVYQRNEAAIKAYERVGFTGHMLAMRKGIK